MLNLNIIWFLETTTIVHDINEEKTTMEAFEDNVTEEYVDTPVTTIQSIPISSTLSSNLHITECPLCECTCPTLSPIMKIHPTPSGESSLNSTSIHL